MEKDNNNNDPNIKLFEKGIEGLFTLIKTIIKCHNERNIDVSGKKNPIFLYFEMYEQIYYKTASHEHIQYFNTIYRMNRQIILKGPFRDEWLSNGKIIIKYGSETGIETNSRIYLSILYNTACTIRNEIENAMNGLPDVDQSKELLYPIVFMLHLYRIFMAIAPSDDTNKLSSFLDEILSHLGISSKSKIDSSSPSSSSSNTSGLQSIVNMAKQFMGKMGLNIPMDKLPEGDNLTAMADQLFNNPETVQMFSEIFEGIKNPNGLGDIMNKVVSKLGDESLQKKIAETMNLPAVKETLNSTLEQAITETPKDNINSYFSDETKDDEEDEFVKD